MNTASVSTENVTASIDGRLRRMIFAFLRNRLPDAAITEDLTQETLIRIHRNLGRLKDISKMDAWVYRIARNTLTDHIRRHRPTELYSENQNPEMPQTEPVEHEMDSLRAYIRSVVEELPSIYREALQLVEYEGLSQAEMARRLGLSHSAAKSRVQRARSLLRKEIELCCHWQTDRYGTVIDVEPRAKGCSGC